VKQIVFRECTVVASNVGPLGLRKAILVLVLARLTERSDASRLGAAVAIAWTFPAVTLSRRSVQELP